MVRFNWAIKMMTVCNKQKCLCYGIQWKKKFLFTGRSGCVFKLKTKEKKKGKKGGTEEKKIPPKTEHGITNVSHFFFLKALLYFKIPYNSDTLLHLELNKVLKWEWRQ